MLQRILIACLWAIPRSTQCFRPVEINLLVNLNLLTKWCLIVLLHRNQWLLQWLIILTRVSQFRPSSHQIRPMLNTVIPRRALNRKVTSAASLQAKCKDQGKTKLKVGKISSIVANNLTVPSPINSRIYNNIKIIIIKMEIRIIIIRKTLTKYCIHSTNKWWKYSIFRTKATSLT